MTGNRLSKALLLLALTSCQGEADPRDQWVVVLGTDAPVPQLGDRLFVEVLDAAGNPCGSCSRIFGVGQPAQWPLSFAVQPRDDGGAVRVRARLYRGIDSGASGLPASDSVIDALAALPPAQGVTRVGLDLRMTCFGVPAQPTLGLSCDPATGELGPEPTLPQRGEEDSVAAPGSWLPAVPVPCPGAAPPDMVCVPGGAFLLGSPESTPVGLDARALPERLVQVSPFYMDVDELTVGATKRLVADHGLEHPFEPAGEPGSAQAACTYLTGTADNDELPVTCVWYALAEQLCDVQGKRLPTEAEWEFAAGNLGKETTYPWGGAAEACERAVVARGRWGAEIYEARVCLDQGEVIVDSGPVAGGHPRDFTELGLLNMAGNMAEWTADDFAPYGAHCWDTEDKLLVDPRCDHGFIGQRTVKGAHWATPTFQAKVFERDAYGIVGASPYVGVRCVQEP